MAALGAPCSDFAVRRVPCAQVRRLFNAIDKDGSGQITFAELQDAISASRQGKSIVEVRSGVCAREMLRWAPREDGRMGGVEAGETGWCGWRVG